MAGQCRIYEQPEFLAIGKFLSENVFNEAEKAKDFSGMLGGKQDGGLVPQQDDKILWSPLVTKEYAKQHLKKINTVLIFLDNSQRRFEIYLQIISMAYLYPNVIQFVPHGNLPVFKGGL